MGSSSDIFRARKGLPFCSPHGCGSPGLVACEYGRPCGLKGSLEINKSGLTIVSVCTVARNDREMFLRPAFCLRAGPAGACLIDCPGHPGPTNCGFETLSARPVTALSGARPLAPTSTETNR